MFKGNFPLVILQSCTWYGFFGAKSATCQAVLLEPSKDDVEIEFRKSRANETSMYGKICGCYSVTFYESDTHIRLECD